MSCWTKEQLENMLEDVVNELDLCDDIIKCHSDATPAQLVRFILDRKAREIAMLKQGMVNLKEKSNVKYVSANNE